MPKISSFDFETQSLFRYPRSAMSLILLFLITLASLMAPPTGWAANNKVTLMLNWLPGGAHVPVFYARETGLYKKAGIDIDIRSARGSRSAFEALRKGDAEFAIAEATELFIQREGGLDTLGLLVYFNRSPNTIFTLQRSDIRSLKDLAGKRIGAPRASFPRVLFKELGSTGKVNLKKVSWLSLPPSELLPALVTGKIDAVASSGLVAYQYHEAARRKGKNISTFPYADAGVNLYSLTLVSMDSVLAKNSNMVTAFVRATAQGMAAAVANPKKALEVFLKRVPGQDRERATAEWKEAHSLIYPQQARDAGIGHFNSTRMETMRKTLTRIRNLRPGASSSNLYTNKLSPDLRPRPGSF